MEAQHYWNEIGSKKEFEDPLFLEELKPFLNQDSFIVEFGCGYGRLLHRLQGEGYKNLIGFDFAHNMIERGKRNHPELKLYLLEEKNKIPLGNESVNLIILSTVLCCLLYEKEQRLLIQEILRVLKKEGVLYLSDFLLCNHSRYLEKYQEGFKVYGEWGIYTTSEDLTVRHFTTKWIMNLLQDFNIQWFKQMSFKTMNHHPAQTFHTIAKKV